MSSTSKWPMSEPKMGFRDAPQGFSLRSKAAAAERSSPSQPKKKLGTKRSRMSSGRAILQSRQSSNSSMRSANIASFTSLSR